jgi:hypothetical protein
MSIEDWQQCGGTRWVFLTILSIKPNCYPELFDAYQTIREDDAWRSGRDAARLKHIHQVTLLFLEHWTNVSVDAATQDQRQFATQPQQQQQQQPLPSGIRIRSAAISVQRLINAEISELLAENDRELVQQYKALAQRLQLM